MKRIRLVLLTALCLVVVYYGLFWPRPVLEHGLSEEQHTQIQKQKPDIVVHKSGRRIFLVQDGQLVKNQDLSYMAWPIALGTAPTGNKSKNGDKKTPEGLYRYSDRSSISGYYGSLWIHYPNAEDAKRGQREGTLSQREAQELISLSENQKPPLENTAMGGLILIHGLGNNMPKDTICLLYTSPSPRDATLSRMPSSA